VARVPVQSISGSKSLITCFYNNYLAFVNREHVFPDLTARLNSAVNFEIVGWKPKKQMT